MLIFSNQRLLALHVLRDAIVNLHGPQARSAMVMSRKEENGAQTNSRFRADDHRPAGAARAENQSAKTERGHEIPVVLCSRTPFRASWP
jgi:hypothetical protein